MSDVDKNVGMPPKDGRVGQKLVQTRLSAADNSVG
jgi:hypothetical protein